MELGYAFNSVRRVGGVMGCGIYSEGEQCLGWECQMNMQAANYPAQRSQSVAWELLNGRLWLPIRVLYSFYRGAEEDGEISSSSSYEMACLPVCLPLSLTTRRERLVIFTLR